MLPRLIDRSLDWTVVPGYSRPGFALRRRFWDGGEPEAGLAGWSVLVTGASSGIGGRLRALRAPGRHGSHAGSRPRARRARPGSDPRADRLRSAPARGLRRLQPRLGARVRGPARGRARRAACPGQQRGRDTRASHRTPEGIELTFATNVLGPFLLTNLLLETLCRGAPSRIVNVSSAGMYTTRLHADDPQLDERDYDPATFYAHTKRCQVILTQLWAERLRGTGVSVHSMHPEWADTPGVRASLPRFRRLMLPLLRNPDQAADTIVRVATAGGPAAQSGRFWHDRVARPTHRLPWTRESEQDRRRLWERCERLAGLGERPGHKEGGPSRRRPRRVDPLAS